MGEAAFSGSASLDDTVDQVTRRLIGWLEAMLPGQAVRVVASGADPRPEGVSIRLRQAVPQRRPPEAHAPLTLTLVYEIGVRLADPLAEQRVLGELAFAALAEPELEIEPDAASVLVVRTRLLRARPAPKLARVREPLRTDMRVVGALQGIVLGPGDVPLPDIVVAIPALGRRTGTDAGGRFRFAAVPSGTTPLALTVDAKGMRVDLTAVPGSFLTIRVPLES